MTVFDDLVRTNYPCLTDAMGTSVTYAPDGGTAVTIDVLWRPGDVLPDYYATGEDELARGVVEANSTDVSSPDLSDTFVIDGETWAVERIGRSTPTVELQLVRRTAKRIGGDHSRLHR